MTYYESIDLRKTNNHMNRRGRHVEFGYAIARDMWIAVIGEPENVFHLLSDGQVERFDSLDAMLEAYQ